MSEEESSQPRKPAQGSVFTTADFAHSEEFQRRLAEVVNKQSREDSSPAPSPSRWIRAQGQSQTIGIRTINAMKNKWTAMISAALILIGPTWGIASMHFGSTIGFLEERVEELEEKVDELEDERSELIDQLLENN